MVYLSPTQLNRFVQCSWRWFIERRVGLRTRPTSFQAVGLAIHAAVEANYRTKLTTGALAPADVIEDIAGDTWDTLAKDVAFEPGENPGALKDDVVSLSRLHHAQVAPAVDPVAVEAWLDVKIGKDITLRQRADVITRDGVIADTKVFTRRASQDDVALLGQLTSYAVGYLQHFGHLPHAVELHQLLRTNKKHDVAIVRGTRTTTDCERYLRRVVVVANRIRRTDVHPVDDWRVCSYCPFRQICLGREWWKDKHDPSRLLVRAREEIPEVLMEPTHKGW